MPCLTHVVTVSIHAPARGATSGVATHSLRVSIHAPARGATRTFRLPRRQLFQSTRPRGARPGLGHMLHVTVSIHAPARGATATCRRFNHAPARDCRAMRMFQSTRPRGARRRASHQCCICSVSIHAPARGATTRCSYCGARGHGFQSTRPRGARPVVSGPSHRVREISFNPRARAGRDASHPVTHR